MSVALHVTQTCTIGGTPYNVHSSSVELGLNTILRMRFVVDVDANSGNPAPGIGQTAVLVQVGNGTQTFRGIVRSVHAERGINYTRWAVDAEGLAGQAAHRRFLIDYRNQTAKSMLAGAWLVYGPPSVTVVAGAGEDRVVENYDSIFDSVLDLANFLINFTGWVWESHNTTFRFFDPAQETLGLAITQSDFEAGTLVSTRDLSAVFNVARMQAWEYNSLVFNRSFVLYNPSSPNACEANTTRWSGPSVISGRPINEWEFVDGEVVSGRPGFNVPLSTIKVSWSEEDQVVITSVPVAGRVRINARFRRLVWVQASSPAFFDLLGAREAPVIPNDGGVDIEEALRRLTSFLRARAEPPAVVSGSYMRTDIFPGDLRLVTLGDLGVSDLCTVEAVKRTYSRDGLRVDVTLRTLLPGDIRSARPQPDPLPEVYRRLTRVENKDLSPSNRLGSDFLVSGPIRRTANFVGAQVWEGEFAVEPLTEGITIEEDF